MKRFWGLGLFGVSLCSVLVACGSSDSGSPAGNAGSGNSAGAGASSDSCVTTPDALFAPQQFGETDLIRQIAVDGDTLYFRTEDTLLKVAAAGGKPEVVADLSTQQPDELWVQADSLLVRSGADLFTVPKTVGASKMLPALVPGTTPFAATQLDGTDFYWVAQDSGSYGIYHRELSGSTVDTLYSSKDELRDLQLIGSTLYFVNKTAGDIEGVAAAGGTPSKLTAADGSDDIVAGDDKSLFVIGTLGAESATNYGLYRQPIAGGDAGLLETGLFITDALDTFVDSSGAYFAAPSNVSPNHADATDVSPALLFAAPSDTAAQLRWCIDSSYTLHALAVKGKTAYVSVYSRSANKATIARVTLP